MGPMISMLDSVFLNNKMQPNNYGIIYRQKPGF